MPKINPLLVLLAIGGVIWFISRRMAAAAVAVKSITASPTTAIRGTAVSFLSVITSDQLYTADVRVQIFDPAKGFQGGSSLQTVNLFPGMDNAVTSVVVVPTTAPIGLYTATVQVAVAAPIIVVTGSTTFMVT